MAVALEWRSTSWQQYAACADDDADLFFAADEERGESRRRRSEAALAVCRRCHVRKECLEYALATDQRHGVWGGTDELERAALLARRRLAAAGDVLRTA